MRRLILLICVTALLTSPALAAWGTPTITANTNSNATCGNASTTNCAITLTTSADHLIVAVLFGSSGGSAVHFTAGPAGICNVTWVEAPSTNQKETGTRVVDIYYCTQSLAVTATSETWTVSATNQSRGIIVYDISYDTTNGLCVLDNSNGQANNTSATTQSGVAFTLTGSSDFQLQVGYSSQTNFTSINNSYTSSGGTTLDKETARKINTNDATAPTWTYGTAFTQAVAGVSFKEASAATSNVPRRTGMIVK